MGNGFPIINGNAASWAEMTFKVHILGAVAIPIDDIVEIDYADMLEPGKARGAGPRIKARTVGEYDTDGSMGILRAAFKTLQLALNSVNPGRIGLVPFDIVVQWVPLDFLNPEVITDKLVGCRIAGRAQSAATGPDPSKVTCKLSLAQLELDGITLV